MKGKVVNSMKKVFTALGKNWTEAMQYYSL